MSNDKIYEDFDSDWSPSSAYPRIHEVISHPNFKKMYTKYLSESKKFPSTKKEFEKFIAICLLQKPNFKMSGVTKSAIKEVGKAKEIFEEQVLSGSFLRFAGSMPSNQFQQKIESLNQYKKNMTTAQYASWYTDQLTALEEMGLNLGSNIGANADINQLPEERV